jgi:hypothetical protein
MAAPCIGCVTLMLPPQPAAPYDMAVEIGARRYAVAWLCETHAPRGANRMRCAPMYIRYYMDHMRHRVDAPAIVMRRPGGVYEWWFRRGISCSWEGFRHGHCARCGAEA